MRIKCGGFTLNKDGYLWYKYSVKKDAVSPNGKCLHVIVLGYPNTVADSKFSSQGYYEPLGILIMAI